MLVDLHIHSTFSDGKLTIPEIVDFYGKRGFGAIAITDHLCESGTVFGKMAKKFRLTLTKEIFPQYLEVIRAENERALKQYKMTVIPGYEITKNSVFNSKSAHILALGVDKCFDPNAEIKTLAANIREAEGVSVAAHPVNTGVSEKQTYYLWKNREELRHSFDAWEVASGPHLFHEVLRSGLPIVANSDLHRPHQINSWKTVINCERTQEAVLSQVRDQRVSIKFYQDPYQNRYTLPALVPS